MANTELKQTIQASLKAFEKQPLGKAAIALLETMGYRSDKRLPITPNTAAQFQSVFDPHEILNPAKALLNEWRSVDFLFQVTDEEIRGAVQGQASLFSNHKVDGTVINSYLFFAVELNGNTYTRTQLATATREINKLFPMPVMVLFLYDKSLTLAIITRRLNKRDASKDVLEKVTLIKGISTLNPHRAHIEILHDLSVGRLADTYPFSNFVELQRAWEKTLDTSELNKKFYSEVADWYFWASGTAKFPKDAETEMSVIRLITRLIFVWFIKEKGLVPNILFDEHKLKDILQYNDPKKSDYYKAILQNLFFATLNTEMGERKFRGRNMNPDGLDQHLGISTVYRYENYFKLSKEAALRLFAGIPFLNGGLFECLDKPEEKIYIDGFSDTPKNQPILTDELFFGKERTVDLSKAYGDDRRSREKVRGLIPIFESYKFTVEENTPIEEEIALDPELLGKVFENLLAAYNPETGTTARKQTGSFYTPREIVNYMVDESLIAYLESKLEDVEDTQARLHHLLAYNNEPHQFLKIEEQRLITAIDSIKVLDPACGSGAFPMGILHKLVFILNKLDPQNKYWKERQVAKASEIIDAVVREAALESVDEIFQQNFDDYGRKLYLIENCIYGVDIQPIAVQIAKLRFFISLVVEQKTDPSKGNLGIRPLPNLETKFVAGNTLIGINRPGKKSSDDKPISRSPEIEALFKLLIASFEQYTKSHNPAVKAKWLESGKQTAAEINAALQNDSSFNPLNVEWIFETQTLEALKDQLNIKEIKASTIGLRNLEIEDKEKELERVRRELFSARTPATKRKYRDLDKKLRQDIASLLSKNHALEDETAQQLAGWDPYNQNTHAEFFDPEWMFGVENGFDITLGNPPYVDSENMVKTNPDERAIIAGLFETTRGNWDLYVPFWEKSINLCKPGGVATLITPNKWLSISYGKALRRFSKELLYHIVDYSKFRAFEDTGVFTVVAFMSKTKKDYLRVTSFIDKDNIIFDLRLAPNLPSTLDPWGIFLSKNLPLVLRIMEKSEKLSKICDAEEPFTVSEAYSISENIHEEEEVKDKFLKFINTGTIDSYASLWGMKLTTYLKTKYNKPVISEKEMEKNYPRRYSQSKDKKIIISGIRYFESFLDNNGEWVAGKSTVILRNFRKDVSPKFLLGLLNSRLITFFLRESYGSLSMDGGINFSPMNVSEIPISGINNQAKIINLVDRILSTKHTNPVENTSSLEAEIDQLVYGLYELTENEIKIVEGREGSGKLVEEDISNPDIEEDKVRNAPAIESLAEVVPTDYSLYKCGECGKIVTDYMIEEHIHKSHRGRQVEWKKMGG